jgi:hypothetical protein
MREQVSHACMFILSHCANIALLLLEWPMSHAFDRCHSVVVRACVRVVVRVRLSCPLDESLLAICVACALSACVESMYVAQSALMLVLKSRCAWTLQLMTQLFRPALHNIWLNFC